MKDFESIAGSLVPDDRQALLLLDIPDGEENLKRVVEVSGSGRRNGWSYEILNEGPPVVVLIRMEPGRARDAIIRLIESGVSRIIAVYPKPSPGGGGTDPTSQ